MANVKEIAGRGAELYNQGKLDEWAATWAEDIEFVSPMSGPLKGRQAVKGYFAQGRQGFPDAKVTIQRMVVEGNVIVIEYTVAGTNTGPLAMPTGDTIPATNRPFKIPSVDIATYDESGKVTSLHQYMDIAGALQQLGLMPAPARA